MRNAVVELAKLRQMVESDDAALEVSAHMLQLHELPIESVDICRTSSESESCRAFRNDHLKAPFAEFS